MIKNKRHIEVAYASPKEQVIIAISVDEGCTIEEAIQASGILLRFPEISLKSQRVGIFSRAKLLTDLVENGDRVEIYRPLVIDPKEARRAKAKKN